MNPTNEQLGWSMVATGLDCLVLVQRELELACEGHNSELSPSVSVPAYQEGCWEEGRAESKAAQGSAEAGTLTHISSKVQSQLQRVRSL